MIAGVAGANVQRRQSLPKVRHYITINITSQEAHLVFTPINYWLYLG